MSYFINEYLRRGYKGIVVESESEEEKGDFHATEKHYETALAEKDGKFVHLKSYEKVEFGPGCSHDLSIVESPATSAEYNIASHGKRFLDTEDVRAQFEAHEKNVAKAAQIRAELRAEAPECEVHGKKMTLEKGPKQYFWGCPKFPSCTEKKWLSGEQKRKANALNKLP